MLGGTQGGEAGGGQGISLSDFPHVGGAGARQSTRYYAPAQQSSDQARHPVGLDVDARGA